jgi:hypothetical protein
MRVAYEIEDDRNMFPVVIGGNDVREADAMAPAVAYHVPPNDTTTRSEPGVTCGTKRASRRVAR